MPGMSGTTWPVYLVTQQMLFLAVVLVQTQNIFHSLSCIFYSCVSKIALFDKALVSALACGALAMCAMWVGNCFKKCAVGKK